MQGVLNTKALRAAGWKGGRMWTLDTREYIRWLRRLSKLTLETPVFGLLGKELEYERSFYKMYFKSSRTGAWWRLEGQAGPSLLPDPLEYQLILPEDKRVKHLSGTIRDLRGYTCFSSRLALREFFERVQVLLNEEGNADRNADRNVDRNEKGNKK
jgi:hypothetical protein